jgi:hypothetical protein
MVSDRMKKLMGGWKQEKNTKPRRNALASVAASKMTAQQIKNLLNRNLLLNKNVLKNIEHRMRNLAIQNNNMRRYMGTYISKK